MHLCRGRPEGIDRRGRCRDAAGSGRDGLHHRGHRGQLGLGPLAVHRALFGLRDGRVFHVVRQRGRQDPRRRQADAQARHARVRRTSASRPWRTASSRCCCAPPARPGGLPGRRVLPAQPAAGTGHQAFRRQRRRVALGAAHHRNPGRRRLGVHPHQRDLDHGRPDLSRARALLLRRPPRDQRGDLGEPRGRQRARSRR